ncbi:MAG TPA: ornithine cyclodeaminase family protein [Candidatus Aminicenantes bacterium]|nr:MAG: ornithine cyclodeaminase [Candidatus Aminicenantes bacterium]HEK86619.1 ornithine cyclodeaminase family protein [Candidatus Aminicenantes bacterium]
MKENQVLLLSSADILNLCPMAEAIEAVREAFILTSENRVEVPPRIHLDVPKSKGTSLVMPSHLPDREKIGVKIINLYEENPLKGLPFSHALMLIFEASTGQPLGIMEAGILTALRTGAACGLATELLSRPESRKMALLGAGFQARFQLEAVAAVRQLEEVLVFDQDKDRAEKFAQQMSTGLGIKIRVVDLAAEAVSQADIISTATTSKTPVFADKDVKAGVHINAIGSYKPGEREVPSETVIRARVFVDKKDMALEEAGDLIIPIREGLFSPDKIVAEIGEVASGKKPGRLTPEEVTFFKTVGVAPQDIVLGSRILEKATKEGHGTLFDFYHG